MKKLLQILLIVIVAAVVWFLLNSRTSIFTGKTNTKPSASPSVDSNDPSTPSQTTGTSSDTPLLLQGTNSAFDEDIRPATLLYRNAQEALAAVEIAAKDYDDLVLEQFVEPDADCSWCPEFYQTITQRMLAMNTSEDEQSYYGELLAISGRKENIEALVGAIRNAPNQDSADIFAEALELTIGNEEVVDYLATELGSDNALLNESLLAAITNHGSYKAVQTIYDYTVKNGDSDGYYSIGIGLAEIIPDDESIPYLAEAMNKRDQYSHLAVKALINGGYNGVKLVVDNVNAIGDPTLASKLLEDAIDHVSYDERTESLCKDIISRGGSNVAVTTFCQETLEEFQLEEEYLEDEDEEFDDDLLDEFEEEEDDEE